MLSDDFYRFLLGGVAGASVVGSISYFVRHWITTRLTESIRHDFDLKLEKTRAENKLYIDAAVARLREQSEQRTRLLEISLQSHRAVHVAVLDRRLAAIDGLWQAVRSLQASMPGAIPVWEEVDGRLDRQKARPVFEEFSAKWQPSSFMKELNTITASGLPHKLFAGQRLWALYSCYQILWFRTLFHYNSWWHGDASILKILKEESIAGLVGEVLGAEEAKWLARGPQSSARLRHLVEERFIETVARITSGEEDANYSLEEATRIATRIAATNVEPTAANIHKT